MACRIRDIQQRGRHKKASEARRSLCHAFAVKKEKENAPWVPSFATIEPEKGRNGRNAEVERERERWQAENCGAGVSSAGDGKRRVT